VRAVSFAAATPAIVRAAEMSYRAQITIPCILIAFWMFMGIYSYYSGNWAFVVVSAYFIGTDWKEVWRVYDEAKGRNE
jgi:hypothetical protein